MRNADARPLRIVYLGPFPPPHGGVQTNLVALRDHARTLGHTAQVINLTRHRRENADGVFYPHSALETARLLAKLPADILHLHIGGILSNRLLGLTLYATLLPGRKTVLTFHSGGYPASPQGQATTRNSFAGFVLRRLDALVAVNQDIGDFFERCGVERRRIHFISPYSLPAAESALPHLFETFFRIHAPVLVGIGGMEPEYSFELQMDALGELRKTHPKAGLILIGSGRQEKELRSYAASLPYAEHVLLAGDVPHPVTLRILRECDIMLRPSHYDGDAISVREALAMGAPVIATDNKMRPPGCHLIPMPPRLDALVDCIRPVLAHSKDKLVHRDTGASNLDAVMDLYRSL